MESFTRQVLTEHMDKCLFKNVRLLIWKMITALQNFYDDRESRQGIKVKMNNKCIEENVAKIILVCGI